jgi:monofunctional glycosyltransferase
MFRLFSKFALLILSLIGLAMALALFLLATTPRPDQPGSDLKGCLTTALFSVELCPKNASYIRLQDVSPHVKNAILATEDSSFYSHSGFDWYELRNSMEQNIAKGKYARGGSTITQQLAKNVYLSSEKSLLRKLREAIVTMQIEKYLSKNEILEKYINVVEFGPKVFGVVKASQYYFQKPASSLSVCESAWLAFLLPNPNAYNSSFRQKKLTVFASRQLQKIIRRMGTFKYISAAEVETALNEAHTIFGITIESDQALEADISVDSAIGSSEVNSEAKAASPNNSSNIDLGTSPGVSGLSLGLPLGGTASSPKSPGANTTPSEENRKPQPIPESDPASRDEEESDP